MRAAYPFHIQRYLGDRREQEIEAIVDNAGTFLSANCVSSATTLTVSVVIYMFHNVATCSTLF